MERDCTEPSTILKNTRTPRDLKRAEDVKETLLSDSTSGIYEGNDEDNTSIDDTSFSSVDIVISNKEGLLTFGNRKIFNKNNNSSKKFRGIGNRVGDSKPSNENLIKITINPSDSEKKFEDHVNIKPINDTPSIPDGGWGWVVVFSSFVISMIADGISFSFGLLYIEFLDEFKTSKSLTAWIGSLFIAVPLLSGPVMSALVDRYGCRSMTILGGIVSAAGFALASISKTIEMMMITFGVIAGLGLGLVYVTAVVSIAYWFEKKRNLAVGLGACGTGVGTFVYAPMTQYFIDEYGWRGTILLLSGTLLNLCVCGCVMRDPEWWIMEQKRQRHEEKTRNIKEEPKSRNSSLASIADPYVFDFDAPTRGKGMKRLIVKGVSPEKVIKDEVAAIIRHENILSHRKSSVQVSRSVENLPTYLTYDDKVTLKTLESIIKVGEQNNIEIKHPNFGEKSNNDTERTITKNEDPPAVAYTDQFLQRTRSEKYHCEKEKSFKRYKLKKADQNELKQLLDVETKSKKTIIKQDSKENRREWLKKQLSVNHHYLKDLKMPLNSISHRNAMLNIKIYRLKASSCPDIFKNSMITINEKEEKWYDGCLSCLADMFNVALFKKMTFNLMCLGTLILFVWFIVPYFYLAEHMIHRGYNEDDGAVMLSLIGITNTIGMIYKINKKMKMIKAKEDKLKDPEGLRLPPNQYLQTLNERLTFLPSCSKNIEMTQVGLGWIGDFPKVSIGNLYAVCLVLCGASVAAIPSAAANYWALASISALFGLLFAASFTFTPSLLVKLVSLDDFTSAYGLVLLAQGIGHLIGPPLSGLIYDLTFSWELAFYLAGGWIMVSGVLISFIQPVKNYQDKRNLENGSEPSIA